MITISHKITNIYTFKVIYWYFFKIKTPKVLLFIWLSIVK